MRLLHNKTHQRMSTGLWNEPTGELHNNNTISQRVIMHSYTLFNPNKDHKQNKLGTYGIQMS